MTPQVIAISAELAGQTFAAILRAHLPKASWSQVRRLIESRRARIDGELCLDPARRLKEGESVEILERSAPKPRPAESVVIRYLDPHIVVVEKPSGLSTVRHPAERTWAERRKKLSPTLEDIVPRLIAVKEGGSRKGRHPRLRIVQRLDKETSGLVVFARTVKAEQELGRQFRRHTVIRRYLAIVPGRVEAQRVATHLVRDRGDGRRGSTTLPGVGKEAITHIDVEERLPGRGPETTPQRGEAGRGPETTPQRGEAGRRPETMPQRGETMPPHGETTPRRGGYTLVSCRLETGRTHQIRIHLAELGHPVCGERVYNRKLGEEPALDRSGAPRLALHAVELGFQHPVTGQALHWTMPLPADLQFFLDRLRGSK
jgi:23S rRNA pseudouridine1911/1915/1917 synthase